MENKNKTSIIIIVLFGLIILGLVGYICYDKGVFGKKENTTKNENNVEKVESNEIDTTKNDDIFANDKIHAYYYETKQEGSEKYILTLIDAGYFSLRYVSAYESGSEAPIINGYYSIKDNKLNLKIGPFTNDENLNNANADNIFKKMGVDLEVDPEQDWRNSNPPSYYKKYVTENDEKEITIGNKVFYRVN